MNNKEIIQPQQEPQKVENKPDELKDEQLNDVAGGVHGKMDSKTIKELGLEATKIIG